MSGPYSVGIVRGAAVRRPRYLIDNSVWARLSTDGSVVSAFAALVAASRPSDILICPPIATEYGFSARNGVDHDRLMLQLSAFTECPSAPSSADALAIQNKLWNGGLLRAAGATDAVIAAYAIANDATVVHYDRDYELIASVVPGFTHAWIVPRGSLGEQQRCGERLTNASRDVDARRPN